jgi:hypothetical protein
MKIYFDNIGHVMSQQTNPAEFILDLINIDFATDKELAQSRLLEIHSKWDSSSWSTSVDTRIERITSVSEKTDLSEKHLQRVNFFLAVLSLLHRSFIKSYRDIVAYGIRAAMYIGLSSRATQILSIIHMLTFVRVGNFDGNCLAAIEDFSRIHTTFY